MHKCRKANRLLLFVCFSIMYSVVSNGQIVQASGERLLSIEHTIPSCFQSGGQSSFFVVVFDSQIQSNTTEMLKITQNGITIVEKAVRYEGGESFHTDLIVDIASTSTFLIQYLDPSGKVLLSEEQVVHMVPVIEAVVQQMTCPDKPSASIEILNDNIESILWSNGSTANLLTNLGPGSYTASMTTDQGCILESTYLILDPEEIEMEFQKVQFDCDGFSEEILIMKTTPSSASVLFDWAIDGLGDWDDPSMVSIGQDDVYNMQIKFGEECIFNRQVNVKNLTTRPFKATDTQLKSSKQVNGEWYEFNLRLALDMHHGDIDNDESDGSIYDVSFHASRVEAELAINPISESYVSQPTTVYARVQSPTSCFETSKIELRSIMPIDVSLQLVQDEVCDHEVPFILSGGMPAGGVYSVTQCSQGAPCPVSPISLDATSGQYLFDPQVGEGIYTIEYTVTDDTGLPSSATDLLAVQAFNFDFFVAASTICANSGKIEIATGPAGQIITGIGVISEIQVINGRDRVIYYFDPTGLSSGRYNITSDYTFTSNTTGYSCSDIKTKQVEIFDFPVFSLNSTATQTCAGESVTMTSAVASGVGSPSYLWAGPNNFSSTDPNIVLNDITTNQSGTYALTVQNENGCTSVETIELSISEQPTLICEQVNMVSCFGESDGVASVTVQNPSGDYTYEWTNGIMTSTVSGLRAGDHSVTVTDVNGCASICTVTIESPELLTLNIEINNQVSCFAGSDGRATATITGGVEPYLIEWDDVVGQEINNTLTAGIKTIKITDAQNCVVTQNITITAPPVLECTVVNTIDVNCNGESTGAANITVQGGSPGYTYLWDNGEKVLNARLLDADIHTLTITDQAECTTTCQVIINQPEAISISLNLESQVSCNQALDGSASATVSGGSGIYNYLWDNGERTPTAVSLSAGLHHVTITDQNACQDSSAIEITQPNPLILTVVSQADVTCFNESNGAASITISGGSPQYTIIWSNGQNSLSVNSLAAGIHTVSVTDAEGCVEQAEIMISQPMAMSAQPQYRRQVSCHGGDDGAATINMAGGSAPYRITWPNGDTGPEAENLEAGNHTVIITDNNNCAMEATLIIQEPEELVINMNVGVPVRCFGESTGSADVVITGGMQPYHYEWDNEVKERFNPSLASGERFVSVTDGNGCLISASVVIEEPVPAVISIENMRPHLCGDVPSGEATVFVDGPSTYNFAWNNGEIGPTAMRLGEGEHVVSITDQAGCMIVQEVIIDMISSIICDSEQLRASSCAGKADGSAVVSVLNGIQVKSYLWDSGETTAQADQLTPGIHTVTITDVNDCSSTCEVEIELLEPLVLACNKLVNYSLGPDCALNFYPDLVIENFTRDFDYSLIVTDDKGIEIDTNLISEYINKNINYTIQDDCNGNTCGGQLKIEDKLGPVLECRTSHETCMSLYDFDQYELPVIAAKSINRLSKHEFEIVSESDCSEFTLSFTDELVEGDCDAEFLYEVKREWTATDAHGNISTCIEDIHVSEATLTIYWPKDTLVYGCMAMNKELIREDATHPLSKHWMGVPHYEGLDTLNEYFHSICSDLYPAYHDDIVELCTGSYKILRTWDIVKDCSSTQEQKTQVIYVQSAFPELVQRDTIVKISTGISCAVEVTLRPDLSHYCGLVDQVTAKIYHESEMDYCLPYEEKILADPIKFINGEIIIPDVEAGCNFIEMYVQSDCYHIDTLQFNITVEDYLAPVVVCDQAATVVLGSDGIGYLAPENVDNGSWDNCGISQRILVKTDTLCALDSVAGIENKISFCCEEIGAPIRVAMIVTDIAGNESSCYVNVQISENEYPTIECPDNLIIPCTTDYEDLEITGRPWAASGCSNYEFIYQDSAKHNQCRNQLIKRTWHLVRSQDTTFACLQDIQLFNENPFTEKYIQWPSDTIIENCYADVTPEELGRPIIDTLNSCSLIASNFFDKEFSLSLESCRSIVREWTIIDWCQYDDDQNIGSWKKSQIIKIHDNIAPVITCEDMEVCTYERDCTGLVEVYSTASDNCSAAEGLSYEYRLDLEGSDGTDSVYRDRGASLSMVLPVGEHSLFTYVNDQCNNTSECYRKIVVKDCKAPTPYCIGQTATTILNTDDYVEIWAVDFNLASSDNCSADENLEFSFEEDSLVNVLVIKCEDILSNGSNDFRVGVWVSDEAGNADVCYVNVEVAQRAEGGCVMPDTSAVGRTISGLISDVNDVALSDAKVHITDGTSSLGDRTIDIEEGFFEMKNAVASNQYRLEFTKQGDVQGGISTTDLIQIQNHILNLRPFESDFKVEAADANNDGKVTSIDLVLLKQLIIGQREDLPAYSSPWKFLYYGESTAVKNMDDSTIGIADMSTDVFLDVKAIKVGDVNGSFSSLLHTENRSQALIDIFTENIYYEQGEEIAVKLRSKKSYRAEGLQLYTEIDNNQLVFDRAEWNGNLLGESEVYFHDNALHFNVVKPQMDLTKDDFTIYFTSRSAGELSQSFWLKKAHLPNEIIQSSGESRTISLRFKEHEDSHPSLEVESVYPNPFIDDAMISFTLTKPGSVGISIMTSDGRLAHQEDIIFSHGSHTLKLSDIQPDLEPGMYYITLLYGKEKRSQSIIKIAP